MSVPRGRLAVLGLVVVLLAGAAAPAALGAVPAADANPAVAGSGAADTSTAAQSSNATNASLTVEPADADAASTHTWSFDDVAYAGEVDTITVDYPVGTNFDGLTEENVTVAITRDGESEPTDISVNSDAYAGSAATFDLSGIYNTDIDGPVIVTIEGVENPAAGNHTATLTFEGDDTVAVEHGFAVAGSGGGEPPGEPVAADLALDPDTAGAASAHTWSFDDVDYAGEVDVITVDYPVGTSFDGLTDDDVTVAITRDGESEPTDISVNSGDYGGSQATFDLSGIYNTDIDGPVVVTIDGVQNPAADEHTALLTFDGEDDSVTAEAAFSVAEPTKTLLVEVLDADGNPVSNATVAVELDGPTGAVNSTGAVVLAETDADGVAAVEVEEAGEYAVTVTAPGEGAVTKTVEIDGTTEATVSLEPAEAGTLAALVTDADGEPLPEGTWASLRGDGLDAPLTGQLDADGVVTLAGVPPGEHSLHVETLDRGETASRTVGVVAGETVTTEFTYGDAPTTATLAGSVATPDGDALASETVVVQYDPLDAGDGAESGAAVVETDANGEFALPFVPAGEYAVTVTADGFAPSDPVTVDLAAGDRADVTLTERAPGSISGVVTDADGEALSEGTWVSFRADGFETARTVRLGPGGTFAIDNVAPGSYDMVAETRNHGTTAEHKVNVATGETSGVEISYATEDGPGNGPPAGVPGEGNPGGPGTGSGPGNGNGPPAIAPVTV